MHRKQKNTLFRAGALLVTLGLILAFAQPAFSPLGVRAEKPEPTEEPLIEPPPVNLPADLETYFSEDGQTAYNVNNTLVLIADNDPAMRGIKIPADPELLSGERTATFSITYVDYGDEDKWNEFCYTFPKAAKGAFNFAANIWASTINSPVPITIRACWANLGSSSILGYSGGGTIHGNFSEAPLTDTWYAASLANSLHGSDLDPANADMHITYNSNFSWYYGVDADPPAGMSDLVSVAAHEIAHGLNFSGSARISGTGNYGYGTGYPNIYDTFMRDGSGNLLTSYTNPSTALGDLLTSENLWFHGSNAMAANGGSRVKIYAPPTWVSGSSYSHLDYNTFADTVNSMMVWALSSGSANHNTGPVTRGLLKDLGWTLSGTAPSANIILSSNTVPENEPINTVVGTLSTTNRDAGGTFTGTDQDALSVDEVFSNSVTDEIGLQATYNIYLPLIMNGNLNAGDTFTYTLVSGGGSEDNTSFNILGDQLRTSAIFDFETKNSYSIRIRSTDQGGLSIEEVFVISVTDVNEGPAGVTILENHSYYVTSGGYLHIVGEVMNNTNDDLRYVSIYGNVFGSSGNLLGSDYSYILLDNLPANQKTCFDLSLKEPAGWSYYLFEPVQYRTGGSPLPNLTAYNDSGSYNSTHGWYEIIGMVRNDTTENYKYVMPVGTLYNGSGTVIGCDFTFVNADELFPGQSSGFEMTFLFRDYSDAASYRLQVDGNVQ